jgi:hypothetical protein
MSLLVHIFLIVFGAGALFFVARRFGLTDTQAGTIAAIGTVFAVIAMSITPEQAPAPTAAAARPPAAPAGPPPAQVTYPLANANALTPGSGGKGSVDIVVLTPANGGSYDGTAKTIDAKAGTAVRLQGWAVDAGAAQAGSGAVAYVDGRPVSSGPYGADRADVAQYLGVPAFRFSGYQVEIPTAKISPGSHVLRVALVSPAGKQYETFGPALKLTVTR